MKKRRSIIISLLLLAALCLGIGYAALSRELLISSSAQLAPVDSAFHVVFTEAKSGDTTKATASITGDQTTANYTVIGLSQPTEDVTLTFKVQNQTPDVDAKLSGIDLTDGTLYLGDGTETTYPNIADYFSKSVVITHDQDGVTYAPGVDATVPDNFVLAPNETATVTIVVTLNHTIQEKTTLMGASVVLDFVDPLD